MSIPSFPIFVKRNGKWQELKTHELLPGDLCFLSFLETEETELTIPCDMLLLAGTCIVNEAMISGESTPLLKESILEHRPEDEPHLTLDIAAADKAHVLFGGTRCLQLSSPHPDIMTQHLYSGKKEGCLALVLRTGFGTMQGQLVRTMIFSSERMSANNMESFIFILFLLIFAIAAAGYVLWHGLQDSERSRYKLLLECVLIITSVVPPELPMELSLAVNNSLVALSKFAIFCMEPFRIPLAGKLDICCFDKTGTLTGENLVLEGVLIDPSTGLQQSKIPKETCLVIGSCHSLFNVNNQIAGDPMEKTAVDFINWTMPRNDFVKDLKGLNGEVEILNRFPFSSALKRMSCVIKCKGSMMITAKGAPEMMKKFFTKTPSWYDETFNQLALSGARVIALGLKSFSSPLSIAQVRGMKREQAESNLEFVGFLIFRCPLKPDSKKAVKDLLSSSHKVMMITGDNALTAIYTAKQLEMNLDLPIIQIDVSNGSFEYRRVMENEIEDCNDFNLNKATFSDMKVKQHCFCCTGNALDLLNDNNPILLSELLPYITIFSRTSPSQKEFILTTLKMLGFTTLMCGDGTNDVGALKQAHVGVALLDGRPEDLRKILDQAQRIAMKKRKAEAEQARLKWQARMEAAKAQADGRNPLTAGEILKAKMDEISTASNNMEDEIPMVKLGDASVAAPFTSKISTIESVCNIVRQGRCTLVTTIQMFKILALNSLISAYGLSVLHLAGIRYGDFQVTITGMLLSACFLFLTKSQPLKELSAQRPQSNILNAYLLLSVLCQFAIHVGTLIFVLGEANRYTFPYKIGIKTEFSPSLTNTAVYLLSLIMQVSTFVVNYEGRPFREGLFENKNLRNSLGAVSAIALLAALEAFPDFNEWLQLVPMPPAFRSHLLAVLFVDFFGCLAVDKILHFFFFNAKAKL
jgi:cation-transporting ATPase 13A1